MNCARCGTPNDAQARFCKECGAGLAASCAACGAPLPPDGKFCSACGTPIGANGPGASGSGAADPDASSPSAERRVVSVLFADLVGFTALSETRDAEETRELLTRYFEIARRLVERYGGTVEKFIGDAVMAVWGTPVAHEDDAERAVRSGLDLVDAVTGLGADSGVELTARAGVLTGEAAVSLGADGQGMVAGDMVNTAARLQGIAPPGSVLVGERTRMASDAAIIYEPAGEQLLKGKSAPVPAYRALRVVARVGGAGRSDRLEPPFVGRQRELRMVKDLFHGVGEERRPRLVSVIGQAGIGKSRLAWELWKYLDGLAEVAYWHQGRCPAYGEGVSFWALSEMVRERARIAEGDDPETMADKVQAMLTEFVPDEAERAWLEPAVRELLGLEGEEGGPDASAESLFAAWRTLFERIAARGTTVLIFEDLHWADSGLLDFIEHLLEWSRDQPIYVVTLARPELFERRPDWGAGWRNLTTMGLEPLPRAAMRELLEGLVPGLPSGAIDRILDRAEGVPLYAVETVRMLLADGRLEPADGAYRPIGDLADLAVPETLHALVASRLDALPPSLRSLVQEASVLGKTFSLQALVDVTGSAPGDLERPLRELVRRELMTLDADPRSPERGQYGFVQSVIREIAYGTLARRERRRLHLAAARHFESLGDDETSGVLAGHYLDAYRARPEGPEGAAAATQARLALRAAADRAGRLASYDLAVRYLEQALEVARDDADLAELHLLAGRTAIDAAQVQSAVRHLEAAVELNAARGSRRDELSAIAGLALARLGAGNVDEVVPFLEAAAGRFADLEGTPEHVELAEALSRAYMRAGNHSDALTWCDRGLVAGARHDVDRLVLDLLLNRGVALGMDDRLTEAVVTMTGVLEMAAERGYLALQGRAFINLGFVLGFDDPARALEASRRGAEFAYRMGLRFPLPVLLGNAAGTAMEVGQWDMLTDLLEPALELNLDVGSVGQIHASLAVLRAYRGEPYEGELAAALAGAPRDDPQARGGIEDLDAGIALAEGRYDDADRHGWTALAEFPGAVTPSALASIGRAGLWSRRADRARRARESLEGHPGRVTAALRRELTAGIAALEGREDEAVDAFLEAGRAYGEMGVAFHRALCHISLVATLGPGRRETGVAAADARKTLADLRAARFIERLDEVRGAVPARPAAPHVRDEAAEQASIGG